MLVDNYLYSCRKCERAIMGYATKIVNRKKYCLVCAKEIEIDKLIKENICVHGIVACNKCHEVDK